MLRNEIEHLDEGFKAYIGNISSFRFSTLARRPGKWAAGSLRRPRIEMEVSRPRLTTQPDADRSIGTMEADIFRAANIDAAIHRAEERNRPCSQS